MVGLAYGTRSDDYKVKAVLDMSKASAAVQCPNPSCNASPRVRAVLLHHFRNVQCCQRTSMWSPFVNHLNVFQTIFCFNWGELCSPHMCNPYLLGAVLDYRMPVTHACAPNPRVSLMPYRFLWDDVLLFRSGVKEVAGHRIGNLISDASSNDKPKSSASETVRPEPEALPEYRVCNCGGITLARKCLWLLGKSRLLVFSLLERRPSNLPGTHGAKHIVHINLVGSGSLKMRNSKKQKEGQYESKKQNNTGSTLPGFVISHLNGLGKSKRHIMFDQYPGRNDYPGVPR